ncbi:YceI family protein [Mycobacterium sp. URHB0044]|jgi:polyisoprenoid-binding protein YceI|uniref:YceI family protein n=1 Tax=Mycobacterium sp. URHB0044 TaxID=1380386 RepID=UPI00048BC990|nr:YceI family protein [Mycobacterium sp. URHB0044]
MTTASDLIANAKTGATWTLDPGRSTMTFKTKTMWGLATVKGTFSDVDGTGQVTADQTITGQLRIGAASLATGIGKRDEHLRSADFFDVEKHPAISLQVHGATVTGDTLRLDATLTVKQIERRLDLPATARLLDDGAVQITTHAEINRKEFGCDGNMLGMIPDTTRLEGEAVFTPPSGDAP